MLWLRHTLIPAQNFEATVAFYRWLTNQQGKALDSSSHEFEIDNVRLICALSGGHEYRPQPTALVLFADRMPSPAEIERNGGRHASRRDFPMAIPPAEEMTFLSDPSDNAICLARPRAEDTET